MFQSLPWGPYSKLNYICQLDSFCSDVILLLAGHLFDTQNIYSEADPYGKWSGHEIEPLVWKDIHKVRT